MRALCSDAAKCLNICLNPLDDKSPNQELKVKYSLGWSASWCIFHCTFCPDLAGGGLAELIIQYCYVVTSAAMLNRFSLASFCIAEVGNRQAKLRDIVEGKNGAHSDQSTNTARHQLGSWVTSPDFGRCPNRDDKKLVAHCTIQTCSNTIGKPGMQKLKSYFKMLLLFFRPKEVRKCTNDTCFPLKIHS